MTRTNNSTADRENAFNRYREWGSRPIPRSLPHRLADNSDADDASVEFVARTIERLQAEIPSMGVYRAVDRYLTQASEFDERCDRWATVRILELATGSSASDPVWPGWRPDVPNVRRRPLRPLELVCLRMASTMRRSKQEKGIAARCATVAAVEAGAVGGELVTLMPGDVHWERGKVAAIDLRGTERENPSGFSIATPRTVEVPMWARASFTEIALDADPDLPLLVRDSSVATQPCKIESALLTRIGKQFAVIGIADDPTVRPTSIRNGAARVVFERDGLTAAMDRLGHREAVVRREIGIDARKPARRK